MPKCIGVFIETSYFKDFLKHTNVNVLYKVFFLSLLFPIMTFLSAFYILVIIYFCPFKIKMRTKMSLNVLLSNQSAQHLYKQTFAERFLQEAQ